jgi:glyoxylase-like metal-dependent hydrolase (beta-lactamase superfamily II)
MLPDGFIFLQRDWLSSNSLLLLNQDQSVLIDSGYSTHAEMTASVLDRSLNGRPLDLILNTHLHSDHCGGNFLLQNLFPKVQIGVPSTQFEQALLWDKDKLSYEKTGQICQIFKPSHAVTSGSYLSIINLPWAVIASPGHDNDSLMFFQPDYRILVSADALWEKSVSVVFPEFEGGNGFDQMLETFEQIEQLNPSVVLPGHGNMFTDIESALTVSREKLKLFKSDPSFHAMYSAKVLIKFKLMELRQVQVTEFILWCLKSSLLLKIHEMFFKSLKFITWIETLIKEFQLKNSIKIQHGWIINM